MISMQSEKNKTIISALRAKPTLGYHPPDTKMSMDFNYKGKEDGLTTVKSSFSLQLLNVPGKLDD